MSKLNHYADRAIEYLFYALFFFVPLILWPRTSEVFEFNKMLFVYAVTILISAAWVIKWIDARKITIRRTPLDLPILLFLASQVLSTIFSIDTHTSLWGYYSRFHGGLMSTISYIILYYALVTNTKPFTIRYMQYAILSSALLVSLYGVLEHFGIDAHLWVQDVRNRVFSTLGQPNWLSAYLVALLPLPIFLTLKQKTKQSAICYTLLTFLFLLTIWFTKSQSGIAATALVLAAIFIYLLIRKLRPTTTNYHKLLLLLPILAIVIFFTVTKWSFIVKISPFGVPNLAAMVETDQATRFAGSDSMVIRQVVWQGARQLGMKNPLFGTGVETFGYSYFTVRPALHNLLSEWEFLYNKAHNEYLNIFANTGFFGLASYLFLIISITVFFKSQITNHKSQISDALFFGYLSILITNYFGFSVVPVALFFFLFPALAFIASDTKERHLSLNFPINKHFGVLLLLLITGYLLLVPYKQFLADIDYNTGKLYLSAGAYKQSLDLLEKAVTKNQKEPVFLAQLAETQAASALYLKNQLDTLDATTGAAYRQSGEKTLVELTTAASNNATKALSMNPHHTNLYKSKAKVELYLGMIEPEFNQQALQTLIDLSAISPTDAKVIYNLGLISDQLGQAESAKGYYQKALQLKPDYDAVKDLLKL
jgi:O-antigen ligase/Tfp pilus assembly protein PilF